MMKENNLFKDIVKKIISDVKKVREEELDCDSGEFIELYSVSHKNVEVMDMTDYPFSNVLTIHNPKYMDKEFLRKRIQFTKSASNYSGEFKINQEKLLDWLYRNIPKHIYMSLERIVITNDSEKDFDELYEDDFMRDVFLAGHDLPDEDGHCFGINFTEFSILAISIKAIEKSVYKEAEIDKLYGMHHDEKYDFNRQLLLTIIHELRHLAQHNIFLPENILNQIDDDDEYDAEQFAEDIYNKNPDYVLM